MADSTRASADMDALEVRPARPEDREVVLAFCARTWDEEDGGDYIADVWDDWLADETGALLVGVAVGRPVAIVHARMVSPDEAWLEGIRVDPALRGHGIGRVMLSRALAAARERGAAVARLFVEQDNSASQRLAARFGFTCVAELTLYAGPSLADDQDVPASPEMVGVGEAPSAGPRLRTPGVEAFEELWAWLVQSNLSPFNGGLELTGWSARALTEPQLQAYLAAGQVLLLEEHDAILALAVIHDESAVGDEPGWLEVRYMDGLAESIGRLALTLRQVAAERGLAEVDLWLPDLLILRDAMNGAGYRRETEGALWVYSRPLDTGT